MWGSVVCEEDRGEERGGEGGAATGRAHEGIGNSEGDVSFSWYEMSVVPVRCNASSMPGPNLQGRRFDHSGVVPWTGPILHEKGFNLKQSLKAILAT